MCQDLSDPENGDIDFFVDTNSTFDVLTTAVYKCDTGYNLTGGDTVRTCLGSNNNPDGDWSGVAPSCEGEFFSEHNAVVTQCLLYISYNLSRNKQ